MLHVVESREAVARAISDERRLGHRIGLVPTMGALHRGHRSLIETAASANDAVVVSVFVNPTQFDEEADFTAYPRDLETDLALMEAAGARYCFAPTPEEMYPRGRPEVTVDPGRLGEILEGESRPGHLRGVATVVAKLLCVVTPDVASFGEKDFQQLALVRRLVQDLSLPVRIVGSPTVREDDGLALSSRNRHLSDDGRVAAAALHRALLAGSAAARGGADVAGIEKALHDELAATALVEPDYATVRRAADLEVPLDDDLRDEPLRLLVAARIESVRLIDNLGIER